MRPPVQVGITAFLWLASSVLMLVFLAMSFEALRSMTEIGGKAAEVRRKNLPEIIENQRSFVNIESLRRLAEVAYVADDPQTRRAARIDAQALAAESIFSDDAVFHEQAQHLARLIATLVKNRDAAHENGVRMQELARDFSVTLHQMALHIPDNRVMQEVLEAFFATSLSKAGPVGMSRRVVQQIEQNKKNDALQIAFIQAHCRRNVQRSKDVVSICERQQAIYDAYSFEQSLLAESFMQAHGHWEVIDLTVREMRDNVSTDSEFVTTDALSAIEKTADKAKYNSLFLFAGGGIFILFYLVVLHWFIVRPVRWVARKLLEIQQGNLDGTLPVIHIAEMYNLGSLLDRFSVHLADLYSHASQLEEDAAEKRDLEELMRAVFQVSLDGYCVWSLDGLHSVSSGILRLLGFKNVDELKKSSAIAGFSSEEELHSLYDTVSNDGIFRKEMHLRSQSGEVIPCEVTYLPLFRQGSVSILSYFRDMREQKRTEKELRAAKEAAEKAAKVKSDFLARMSHEIRTPMNGVLGLTHLALVNSAPGPQHDYLEKIQASARILLGIINDILDFSKLESGVFVLDQVSFSFASMLRTVQDLFRAQANEKNLVFDITSDSRIPRRLRGDELRLSQVLLNLCGNAIKFTDQGKVELAVTLLAEEADSVRLLFTVSDTGVGMSQEQLEGIFLPFSQADISTTRRYGGTGLGLVISKLIVEMMQGEITVVSEPGKGSTFAFAVTMAKAPEKEQQPDAEPETADPEALQGVRALLAEDNAINQEIAMALLEDLGVSVLVAANGQEALCLLETEEVDVVLMDIQMPVLDGLSAASKIRAEGRPAVRDLPIIAMTAHAMPEDREKSFAAGMNDHINKPVDIDELRIKLTRWAGKKS